MSERNITMFNVLRSISQSTDYKDTPLEIRNAILEVMVDTLKYTRGSLPHTVLNQPRSGYVLHDLCEYGYRCIIVPFIVSMLGSHPDSSIVVVVDGDAERSEIIGQCRVSIEKKFHGSILETTDKFITVRVNEYTAGSTLHVINYDSDLLDHLHPACTIFVHPEKNNPRILTQGRSNELSNEYSNELSNEVSIIAVKRQHNTMTVCICEDTPPEVVSNACDINGDPIFKMQQLKFDTNLSKNTLTTIF